ncbi:DsbA family protein [Streptomyces sp. Je 1-4]|uniref:DsbA family protein n=1 Tax=Streptomyces TaxID=1883 RepID=UPI0021D8AAC2|nr:MULTISPECIES: DsbA family protein [unclassified Streptomyces]UYB42940.1 DsbA family protein [Streptomyces sp. Je 1-4]UZQ39280.1 DsbA family protein [Streptomyces sp. Je 1-4] [Streptomyces sp. Je 1-4 4N24]UZQ46697.1 DsbA family protein [Streptomyces sp. Je 1-4] [Streptomyces sp. Je 1-4 4N24_ara]
MSNRNNQANKAAARERIRAERERQKKKEKLRRQLVVAGTVAGVLVVAGGAGFMVMKANEPKGWEAAKEAKPVAPAHTQGKNGTEILIGDKNAKETLEVFEDIRCPACASFEQSSGEALLKDVEDGRYRVRFSMYTFIDDTPAGGEGSKNALSALGAALNVSPEAFLKYKTALYSAKYHPEEQVDSYGKDSELLKVAATVPALKGNKAFETAVKKGTYDRWAMDMTALFGRKGIKQTPSFMHGDKKLVMPQVPQRQMTQAQYNQLAQANFKKMIDTEFGPAKGSGKPDPGKDDSKDEGGSKGIREGEKDPSATR